MKKFLPSSKTLMAVAIGGAGIFLGNWLYAKYVNSTSTN